MIKRLGQAQRQHERRVCPVHDAVKREPNVFRSSDLEIRMNRPTCEHKARGPLLTVWYFIIVHNIMLYVYQSASVYKHSKIIIMYDEAVMV